MAICSIESKFKTKLFQKTSHCKGRSMKCNLNEIYFLKDLNVASYKYVD